MKRELFPRKAQRRNVVKNTPKLSWTGYTIRACNNGNYNYARKRKKTADREGSARVVDARNARREGESAEGRGGWIETEVQRGGTRREEETFKGNKYRKERNRQEWQTTVGPCICPSIFDIPPPFTLLLLRSLASMISAALSLCHAAWNPPRCVGDVCTSHRKNLNIRRKILKMTINRIIFKLLHFFI